MATTTTYIVCQTEDCLSPVNVAIDARRKYCDMCVEDRKAQPPPTHGPRGIGVAARVCHYVECCKIIPKTAQANKKFCSDTCSKNHHAALARAAVAKPDDLKARRRIRQNQVGKIVNTDWSLEEPTQISARSPNAPRPGALRVRRGPMFEQFKEQGYIRLIESGEMSPAEAAEEIGTSSANVHGWLAAWAEDERMRIELASFEPSRKAQRRLRDFGEFRRYYFVNERGESYVTTPYHLQWIDAILHAMKIGGRLQILSPPRHGKAVADDTPMMTSRGWVPAGKVEVGDELVGSDGRFTKVTAVYPQGEVDLFEVAFSDGATLRTCGDHNWSVTQRYGGPARVKTTSEIAEDLVESDGRSKWRIPMMAPFEGFERDLPVDPYIFGAWLGDGKSAGASFYVGEEDHVFLEDQILAAGYAIVSTGHDGNGVWRVGFNIGAGRHDGFQSRAMRLGVWKNKHIPDVYLTASVDQRLALLQGLCDTDGTVAKNGSQQSFCTTRPELAEGLRRLVSSLGGTWTERYRTTSCSYLGEKVDGAPSWEIWFRLPEGMAAFRLDRKQSRLAPHSSRNTPRRFVKAVTPAGRGTATCFTVAAADHLFAAGESFVVTHNTDLLVHFCIWLILNNPNIRIMWIGLNDSIAKQSIQVIRDIFDTNERLTQDFLPAGATFRPARGARRPWSAKELTVSTRSISLRSPTIIAIGKGSGLLSRDVDLAVLDDIIDDESAMSPASRENDLRWLNTQVSSRKESHTALVGIGSRQHHLDLWGSLVQNDSWASIVEHAHDPDCPLPRHELVLPEGHDEWGEVNCEVCTPHQDCILWPTRRTMAWLEGQRFAMENDEHFEMVYQNMTRAATASFITKTDIEGGYNHYRRLGDYPPECHLIAGLDPAVAGVQAAFLWAWHPKEDRRYMVDIDIDKGGGLPGARRIIREWFERYGLSIWIIEKNGYQTALLQDNDIIRYSSLHAISLRPHFTDRFNKWDPQFGVTKQFTLFRTLGPIGKYYPNERPKIDLPYADAPAQAKTHLYRDQLLSFDDARANTKTDIVMAAWFPETEIRRWNVDRPTEITYESAHTSYPVASLGDSYRRRN